MHLNKLKLYETNKLTYQDIYAVDNIGTILYKKKDEKSLANDEIVVDRIQKITIIFSNDSVVDLKQVNMCDYDTTGNVEICNLLLNLNIYNAYSDGLTIKKIIIQGLCINGLNPDESIGFTTSFNNLKIKAIRGGFSTDSMMYISLVPDDKE